MENVKIYNHGTQKAYSFNNFTYADLIKLQNYLLDNYSSVKNGTINHNLDFTKFTGYILVK